MIIPFSKCSKAPHASFDVYAFTGDFAHFSLLYSEADAPDAPAFFAAELFELLAKHRKAAVRRCEPASPGGGLALWADTMPLDAKRWMFYATANYLTEETLAALSILVCGTNGWSPVGRVPTLPGTAVPMYDYENGVRYLLLSDVLIGESQQALAHPIIHRADGSLSMRFGVFPEGYLNRNKLYLGKGGGICFRTKSARALRPNAVHCLLAEE